MKSIQLGHGEGVTLPKRYEPTLRFSQLSNPARTEVWDTDGNWLATFTNGSRTANVKGPMRAFVQRDVPLFDEFTRTRTGTGWGLSTFGGTWSLVGGTDPENYSVNGTEGEVVVDTANVSRRLYLGAIVSDPDVRVRVKTDKTAAGDKQSASILFNYQNSDNHNLLKMDFVPGAITDSFARTSGSGWGTAPTGQAWSTSGGSSSDYAVNAGAATHSIGAVNSSRRTLVGSMTDSDVTVRVKTNALAKGGSMTSSVIARWIDANNHYLLRVRFSTTQTVHAVIQKQVAGVTTDLSAETLVSGVTHSATDFVWVRAKVIANQLSIKVWADGASEPGAWTISATDSTYAGPGKVGLRSILQSGNTNTLPVTFSYSDFACVIDSGTDAVELRIQKRVAGTTNTLGSAVTVPVLTHVADSYIWFRARMTGSTIEGKAWVDGSSEPTTWLLSRSDFSFASGRVGLRAVLDPAATNVPVKFTFDDFYANGTAVNPTTVRHDHWVRVLSTAFAGNVDEEWVYGALNDTTPDALAVAMEYINQAPSVSSSGLQIAGNAHYGPVDEIGARTEGSDFND